MHTSMDTPELESLIVESVDPEGPYGAKEAVYFFFSSRRPHTTFDCDWSSDVCSSDLLALALGVPLVGVNHVEGHVYACRLAAGRDIFPCVGLVVSGGHTVLFHCHGPLRFERLGATLDDAAGEAFDKVASLLGLGFPGGPAVERAAREGNPKAFAL